MTERSHAVDPNQLIVTREQACLMLGRISKTKLRRLMKAGILNPVFLTTNRASGRKGKLYFRTREIVALIEPAERIKPVDPTA